MRYINVCQRLTIRQLNLPHEIKKKQKNKENNMDMMALRINWKEQELGHIIENDVSKMTGCSSVRLFVTQWAVSKPPNISISSLFPFPPPQWGHWAKLLFVCPSVFPKSKFENSAFWSYCYYGTLIENPMLADETVCHRGPYYHQYLAECCIPLSDINWRQHPLSASCNQLFVYLATVVRCLVALWLAWWPGTCSWFDTFLWQFPAWFKNFSQSTSVYSALQAVRVRLCAV